MPAQDHASSAAKPPPSPGWLRKALIGRNWKFTLARLAVLIVSCFVVFGFVLLPARIEGISMLPTYRNGEVTLVNRLAYLWHPPRRGDVVGIRLSDPSIVRPSIMYLKRIIGLPGETVAFSNGRVLIDGRPLAEPYEKYRCDWTLPPVTVKSNQYFVVGDNRSMPPQEHVFGRVDRAQIMGKALR